MHSKCFVATIIVVSIMVTGSCSFLSLSGGKSDFLYGEGFHGDSRSEKLAITAAGMFSRVDISEKIIERYRRNSEAFEKEMISPQDNISLQFKNIIQEYNPKLGAFNLKLLDVEKVHEDVKKKAGKFQVKVTNRIHIGSVDKMLLEKIEKNNELAAEFKKTPLYGEMKKNINKYEKYISKKK